MRKRNRKQVLPPPPKPVTVTFSLEDYDARSYLSDIEWTSRMSHLTPSTREWILLQMYDLRSRANRYESLMAEFLFSRGIEFIHQAPFVFYGKKIYFADFYLPGYRTVIEVDGDYHHGFSQKEYDAERDSQFAGVGIKTLRVANPMCLDPQTLEMFLVPMLKKTGHK